MNAVTSPEYCALELVDIIDFKWLMVGAGHHVHVERLQREPAYARDCLALAAKCPVAAVREAGRRLARRLAPSDALPLTMPPTGTLLEPPTR